MKRVRFARKEWKLLMKRRLLVAAAAAAASGQRKKAERRTFQRGASFYATQQHHHHYDEEEQEDDENAFYPQQSLPSSSSLSDQDPPSEEEEEIVDTEEKEEESVSDPKNMPSKFLLYQQSVQSPKGDISYLQKFFLMYVGERLPLHLQEDFCGTALLGTDWLCSDSRRTAVGVDLDLEALSWCMENNINKVGADGCSKLARFEPLEMVSNINLKEFKYVLENDGPESAVQVGSFASSDDKYMKKSYALPVRDIVCAFNYSCCCLHKRVELVTYFKHVLDALSKKGGIFVMDLYGGTSSEHKLRLQRRFPNFTVKYFCYSTHYKLQI